MILFGGIIYLLIAGILLVWESNWYHNDFTYLEMLIYCLLWPLFVLVRLIKKV